MTEPNDIVDDPLREYATRQMVGFESRDTEEEWRQFERLHFGKRRFNRLKWAGMVAGLLIVLSGMSYLVAPEQVRAIGKQVMQVKVVLTGQSQGLIQGSIQDAGQEITELTSSEEPVPLDAVRQRVPFPIRTPAYVPAPYSLVGYSFQEQGPGYGQLMAKYSDDHYVLRVSQMNFDPEGFGMGKVFDTDDTKVTQCKIHGTTATLLERPKDGWVRVMWVEGNMLYEIGGHVSKDDAVKMAESMTFNQ